MARKRNGTAGSMKRYPRPPLPKTIVCWRCGQDIPLSSAGETCPLCGATLAETSFDEAAGARLREIEKVSSEIGLARQKLAEAETRNARLGFLRKLPLFPSRREIVRLNAELSSLFQNR